MANILKSISLGYLYSAILLSPFSDGITTSDLDLSMSQIGSGGKSQGSLKKKFVAALDKVARRNNSDILEFEQMKQIAMQLGIDNFKNVLESLNEQGYLLKRSAKTYKLLSNWFQIDLLLSKEKILNTLEKKKIIMINDKKCYFEC